MRPVDLGRCGDDSNSKRHGKSSLPDDVDPSRSGRIANGHQAINASETGSGETEHFKFRGFKNGNLHLTFKRLDLVKQLNGLAVGEFVLGKD